MYNIAQGGKKASIAAAFATVASGLGLSFAGWLGPILHFDTQTTGALAIFTTGVIILGADWVRNYVKYRWYARFKQNAPASASASEALAAEAPKAKAETLEEELRRKASSRGSSSQGSSQG